MNIEQPKLHTIAVDAMGGDLVPSAPVEGAILAAKEKGLAVLLVGDSDSINRELAKHETSGLAIEIVPSVGAIREGEAPVKALRSNPHASIAVAASLVRSGKADALVSMGSTGASMAASVMALGLFPGLERPALGGPFIGLAPRTTIMDLGAHIDCRPSQLLSFAALGCAFTRFLFNISNPRVALLSVGSEKGKGNRQVQEAYPLFQASGLNFVGNIEGHEVFLEKADVVVCDGFVGNILLKFTEGLGEAAAKYLTKALGPDSPTIKHLGGIAGAAEAAGPLFGVNGAVIIGHGRSKAKDIANAILRARDVVASDLIRTMQKEQEQVLRQANAEITATGKET